MVNVLNIQDLEVVGGDGAEQIRDVFHELLLPCVLDIEDGEVHMFPAQNICVVAC